MGAIAAVCAAACTYNGRQVEGTSDGRVGPDSPPGTPDAVRVDATPGTPDATPVPDANQNLCPGSYNIEFNGHRYRLGHDTWYGAESACESEGQHLIVIDDGLELAGYDLVTLGDAWVGMSDHVTEGTFRWLTTGSTVTGGWKGGEPSDSGNNEDCGAFVPGLGGGYNDDGCTKQHDYACECDGDAVMPLWCTTDTDSNCNECGDNCTGGDHCNAQQCD